MSEEQKNWLADPTIPEPIRQALQRGAVLERIELDSEGHFWHEGERITDARISDLFHRSIQRTPGGTYLLVVAPFSYPLVVHDVPYWVTGVALATDGDSGDRPGLRVRLNDGSEEELAIDTLRYQPRRGFVCRVKGGTMPARFSRPSYFALAEYVTEDESPSSDAGAPSTTPGSSDSDTSTAGTSTAGTSASGTSVSDTSADAAPGRLTLVLGAARYPIPVAGGESSGE